MKQLAAVSLMVTLSLSCGDIDEALARRRDAGLANGDGGPAGDGGFATSFCRNGFCWENPLPQGNNLRAVFGANPGDVWFVGDVGTVMRWTDGGFENHSSRFPATHAFRSVWGSEGEVWVVGHFDNGGSGQPTALGPMHYAAGAWNEEPWTPTTLTPDFLTVRGSGQKVWAAGFSHVLAERSDAGRWQLRTFPLGAALNNVALPALAFDSDGRCLVALSGDLRGVATCDGGTLELSLDASYEINPNALWSTGPGVFHAGITQTVNQNLEGNLWLRGDGGWALEATEGTTCSAGFAQGPVSLAACGNGVVEGSPPMPTNSSGLPTGLESNGLWAPADSLEGAWLTGDYGALFQFQDGTWVPRRSGSSQTVYSLWVDDQRTLGVGGSGALISRGADSTWSFVETVGAGSDLEDVWVSSDDSYRAYVGVGRALLDGEPGSTTQPPEVPMDPAGGFSLRSVWGTSPNDVWAVGAQGEIWHRSEAGWARNTFFADGGPTLYDIDGTDDGGAYIVGEACTVLQRDLSADGGWRLLAPPAGCTENLFGVWAAPANAGGLELVAVGQQPGVARMRRNGIWSASAPGAPGELYRVWGTAPNDIWAVGANGGLVHHDGGRWERVETGTRTSLGAVRGRKLDGGALELFIAGDNGAVLRRVFE